MSQTPCNRWEVNDYDAQAAEYERDCRGSGFHPAYAQVARRDVPDGSFRYGQLASVDAFDVPESSFAVCTDCAKFEDGSTEDFRTVLVAHFLFADSAEDEARETAARLQASPHVGDVTLVLPARYGRKG